jgi:3-hydroxyisobutyrate dehydrogenase
METIGFIGLGTVGGVVAANILKAGCALTVHDVRTEAMKPLIDVGAESAASPADVARRCRIVFTSLPGPVEVAQVALGSSGIVHGVRDGSLYVDLSSTDPDLIRQIAGEFHRHGARVMDAPLIIGKRGLAAKSVQILASGGEEDFREIKPVLDGFSEPVIYAGALGNGTAIKLAHNLVRRGIGLAIGEGMVLGAKAGADPELLWNCMHWGLDAQLHQLRKNFSEIVFQGRYEAPAGFGIGLARKDVGLATELGRRLSVPMPIAALVEQAMIQAINRGWSAQGTLSLFRLQEEAAGIAVRKP